MKTENWILAHFRPIFGSFLANFCFRAKVKKVTSRAELKIIQLELWLEPARLGLITNNHINSSLSLANCNSKKKWITKLVNLGLVFGHLLTDVTKQAFFLGKFSLGSHFMLTSLHNSILLCDVDVAIYVCAPYHEDI